MTLCIAAACMDGKKERVVIGTDWRVSGAIAAGADIQDKMLWINEDILMLISGEVTRARQLRDCYREVLARMASREPPDMLTALNIRNFIAAGAQFFKGKLSDEVATFSIGMTYKRFRESVAKKEVPESVATEIYKTIEKEDFSCDVLLIAFVDDMQYIYEIEKSGHFEECDNFGLIGEGTYVAEALMYFRKHESIMPLSRTIYHVYEALFMASRSVGSVGKDHTINVLYPPGERGEHVSVDELNGKGFRTMATYFKELGIRKIRKFSKQLPNGVLKPDEDL